MNGRITVDGFTQGPATGKESRLTHLELPGCIVNHRFLPNVRDDGKRAVVIEVIPDGHVIYAEKYNGYKTGTWAVDPEMPLNERAIRLLFTPDEEG